MLRMMGVLCAAQPLRPCRLCFPLLFAPFPFPFAALLRFLAAVASKRSLLFVERNHAVDF